MYQYVKANPAWDVTLMAKADRTQVGPMLAAWTLLSGNSSCWLNTYTGDRTGHSITTATDHFSVKIYLFVVNQNFYFDFQLYAFSICHQSVDIMKPISQMATQTSKIYFSIAEPIHTRWISCVNHSAHMDGHFDGFARSCSCKYKFDPLIWMQGRVRSDNLFTVFIGLCNVFSAIC